MKYKNWDIPSTESFNENVNLTFQTLSYFKKIQ